MGEYRNLPFKVGQLSETRSFVHGYRGAWFRCKIKSIGRKKRGVGVALEYYDFPDEKVRWTKLYQKFSKTKDRTLMIRPCFPPVYHEGELPDIDSISEVVVLLTDVWKVGDLVDWWSDGCYWSGRLTEALGNGKFQIELFPPPDGEGLSYEVSCEDLRPSLDWSPENGWTIPVPKGSKDCCTCARIVKPVNQGSSKNLTVNASASDEGRKCSDASVSSDITASQLPLLNISERVAKRPLNTPECMEAQPVESTACMEIQPLEINKDVHVTDSGIGKTSCSDSASSLRVGATSAEIAGNTGGKASHHDNVVSKKIRTDRSITLNSMSSDTIESAIIDLEELVNRVKWMKSILEFGMPLANAAKPSWEFVEHRASSLPK